MKTIFMIALLAFNVGATCTGGPCNDTNYVIQPLTFWEQTQIYGALVVIGLIFFLIWKYAFRKE